MRLIRIVALCIGACLLPTMLAGQSPDQTGDQTAEFSFPKNVFYLGYDPRTNQNTLEQNILYLLPDPKKFGNGPFPLAVWLPGTFASYRDPFSTTMMRQMALRGFASASVQYNNS